MLLLGIGMTMIILVGQIDISIGSCSPSPPLRPAPWRSRCPDPDVVTLLNFDRGSDGRYNGMLVGWLRLPSIVTLAMLVAWRDALRWPRAESGARPAGEFSMVWIRTKLGPVADSDCFASGARLFAGHYGIWQPAVRLCRWFDTEAARLAGIEPAQVTFAVFVLMGALVGLAALSAPCVSQLCRATPDWVWN